MTHSNHSAWWYSCFCCCCRLYDAVKESWSLQKRPENRYPKIKYRPVPLDLDAALNPRHGVSPPHHEAGAHAQPAPTALLPTVVPSSYTCTHNGVDLDLVGHDHAETGPSAKRLTGDREHAAHSPKLDELFLMSNRLRPRAFPTHMVNTGQPRRLRRSSSVGDLPPIPRPPPLVSTASPLTTGGGSMVDLVDSRPSTPTLASPGSPNTIGKSKTAVHKKLLRLRENGGHGRAARCGRGIKNAMRAGLPALMKGMTLPDLSASMPASSSNPPEPSEDVEQQTRAGSNLNASFGGLPLTAPEPTLVLDLFYDIQRCALTVNVMRAFNLPALDRCGTSDPFVVLYLSPNKEEIFKTAVIKRSLDPVFNQSFVFKGLLPDEVKRQSLVLRVYDHDRVCKNDFIGSVTLPLERADLYGAKTVLKIEEKIFEKESRGDVLLSISYNHVKQTLNCVLVKITNFSKNVSDPYVKVNLLYGGVNWLHWKSTIKKNSPLYVAQVFNESFQFDLSEMDLANVMLQFSVMDHDRFTQDDVIGVFSVGGRRAPSKVGRDHWSQVMSSHGHAVSHWHSLEKKNSKTGTIE